MLEMFIIVFCFMLVTVVLMSVGVLFGRAPIKGSCGGLNNVGVERACGCTEVCEADQRSLTTEKTEHSDVSVYRP